MIRIADFEIDEGLMIVMARITGNRSTCEARLVLDTGTSITFVAPDILHRAGFEERDMVRKTRSITAVGLEFGELVMLRSISVLGRSITQFPINMYELPYRNAIDGLLGLDVLNLFDYEIRPRARQIITRPIPGTPRR